MVKTDIPLDTSNSDDYGFGLAIQSDGKIIVVGTRNYNFAVVRSVAIQSEGKIVVAGYSNSGTNNDFAVVRYNSDGSLDTSFDGDGKLFDTFGSGADEARNVLVQADGKIVVAGSAFTGSTN